MALQTKNNKIAKVILNGETLIDLTDTTATADTVLADYTFLDATGQVTTGKCKTPEEAYNEGYNNALYNNSTSIINNQYMNIHSAGILKPDAITVVYTEYIDHLNELHQYEGFGGETFVAVAYQPNSEGTIVPVIFKISNPDEKGEIIDIDEGYYYTGLKTSDIDNQTYDTWAKGGNDTDQKRLYTIPIVINNPSILIN